MIVHSIRLGSASLLATCHRVGLGSQVAGTMLRGPCAPVNQAQLCDMLPINLQSPAEWSRRSRSALNPSNLADECDVYSPALLFDVSFQILSPTTSVQVINIQGTRGMIIRDINSTWVKHFVGTELLRNTGNISSAVTQNTMEVPASQQNVTQSKKRKVNVPPDPAVWFDTWQIGRASCRERV